MRFRKAVLFGFITLFFSCSYALAGGAGNCVEPIRTTTDHFGVGGGFEYNYVDERLNDLENSDGPRDMKVTALSQVYGKFMIGVFDYFNLYTKIGGCNYKLEFTDTSQNDQLKVDLNDGLYTGMGLNALFPVYKWNNFTFGIGFDIQGNFFYNDVDNINRGGEDGINVDGSFFGLDGQNSIYGTFKYHIEKINTSVTPYIGMYHSWIVVGTLKSLTYETPAMGYIEDEDYQAAVDANSFGLLLGMDIDVAKYVNINIEGRFIGETAVTTGATIKF
ncbi:MAG: hypothetical protein JW994_02225 [Candidatus Omnitrophica bacterium]|nr:hypothetical protein [Candidatus Omnitrophota bacterium]